MPQKATIQRAQRDKRAGKSASTQAGEFVKDEIDRIRAGKHGAKNAKQAIAIGLSEARRAGVDIPDKRGGTKARPAKRKATAQRKATTARTTTSRRRSQAALKALKAQPRRAASHLALSRQAHRVARTRTKADRSAAARKGARTRAANRDGR